MEMCIYLSHTGLATQISVSLLTGEMQVEGQKQVDEEVWQLFCGVWGKAVLNDIQEELHKVTVQMLWGNQDEQRVTETGMLLQSIHCKKILGQLISGTHNSKAVGSF